MVSVNYRGWTFTDESSAPDPESPRGLAIAARAEALMREWSELTHAAEQESFRRASDEERGDYWEPGCCCGEGAAGDPDELCSHDRRELQRIEAADALAREGTRLRLELIEAELSGFGARIKRPYEHWNEDEKRVQWLEEGRFGEYTR